MPRKQKIVDSFWGGEFCSPSGFDNLVRRMKDGREMCKDVEEFMKQRAKIEDDYSKNLLRLARGNSGHTEIGTLRIGWDCLKAQTEKIAQEHINISAQLIERAKLLNHFMLGQREARKKEEEAVKKSMKKKTDHFKKMLECKRAYENRCRELENVGLQIASTKQSGGNTDRNSPAYKVLQAKEHKAKTDKEKSDQNYKDIVSSLDNARLTWERDMTQLCVVAENLEIERFNYLQNEMWIQSNLISQCCVIDDQCCEVVRKSLEKCDVDADIDKFIVEKSTGHQKPSPIRYAPYLDNDMSFPPHPNRAPIPTPGKPPLPPHPHR